MLAGVTSTSGPHRDWRMLMGLVSFPVSGPHRDWRMLMVLVSFPVSGPHTDWGMLTVLATDATPGLQIRRCGAWHDVAPLPGAFVVNVGDLLHRWSGGRFL
jgi:isopenicillin N synthase-like dioxygenase